MEFLSNIEKEEYSTFVKNHPTSHFLKSYEWGEASKVRGLTPYYVGLKEDGKLIATALLLEKKLPLSYNYFYIPRGYTISYEDKDILKKFTEEIKKFVKKKKGIFFKIDPDIKLHTIDKDAKEIEGENHFELVEDLKEMGFRHKKLNLYFENMQPRFTFRIPIQEDMDIIRKRYSKSVIRWMKIADRYGVQVKVGEKEELEEFIRLMKMTEKRQGFFSHNYDFYPKLYDIFKESNSISLLLAYLPVSQLIAVTKEEIEKVQSEEKKQRLEENLNYYLSLKEEKVFVSSYITVHYGNKSWYLYGANDLRFKDTYANYKLFDFQISYAHDLGKEIFDEFGTIGDPKSTRKEAGLHEFKQKFGGEYTEFIGEFTYVVRPFLYFVFDKLVPLYRKPMKWLRHLKVKVQKEK